MRTHLLYIFVLFSSLGFSQDSISELLKKHNSKSIPYISVEQLAMPKTEAIILDSRELNEYELSHLKGAIHVGYDHFDIDSIEALLPNKDQDIVVYCSLGIRSEVIAEELKKAGYTKVKNLYGGIFEWKNKNFSIYNTQEKETDSIHTYSKEWSKWLNNGIKIHE